MSTPARETLLPFPLESRRVPSIFGEGGAEVAIPLPDGSRIPVAEVKRPPEEMKTFEDIKGLLEDSRDRVEFQAKETETPNKKEPETDKGENLSEDEQLEEDVVKDEEEIQ